MSGHVCDVCGKTFDRADRLGAHKRSHRRVSCPECPWTGKEPGLGPHRTKHRRHSAPPADPQGVVARIEHAAAERRERDRRRLSGPFTPRPRAEAERADVFDALSRLLPASSWDLMDRLCTFVMKHQPAAEHWLVATATEGPWLCRPASVGPVVQREGDVAVVVAVAAVYDHLGERMAG